MISRLPVGCRDGRPRESTGPPEPVTGRWVFSSAVADWAAPATSSVWRCSTYSPATLSISSVLIGRPGRSCRRRRPYGSDRKLGLGAGLAVFPTGGRCEADVSDQSESRSATPAAVRRRAARCSAPAPEDARFVLTQCASALISILRDTARPAKPSRLINLRNKWADESAAAVLAELVDTPGDGQVHPGPP